jgi:hypothetical protein
MAETGPRRRRRRRRRKDAPEIGGRERIRRRQRRVRRLVATLWTGGAVVLAVVVAPVLADRVLGAIRMAEGSECRLLTVLDADRYRLDCEIVGRQTARLLGADAPASRGVGCAAEFWAGTRAKWAARARLWRAGAITAELDGFGWRSAPLLMLEADGQRVGRWLVDSGFARFDQGYGEGGWCQGELAALGPGRATGRRAPRAPRPTSRPTSLPTSRTMRRPPPRRARRPIGGE